VAQYDVYRNPHLPSREVIPYIVDIQSDLISQLPTRLMASLSVCKIDIKLPPNLCPKFIIDGQELTLMVYDAAAISSKILTRPVASLSSQSSVITAAMDAVLSGY
jgi:toxin CcdB